MAKQKSQSDPFEVVFFESIREAYTSIIEDFHFSIIEYPPYSVELKSEICLISIYRDWRDNFVMSDIKPARTEQVPKAQYYNSVDVSHFIEFMSPETNFEYGSCSTPEKLRQEINSLAEATRLHCASMMEGDFTRWIELRKAVMKEADIPL